MEWWKEESSSHSSTEELAEGNKPKPYYGCSICQRGFTSAQALGGHMNIHRKHRAPNNPDPINTSNTNPNIINTDQRHHEAANFYPMVKNNKNDNITLSLPDDCLLSNSRLSQTQSQNCCFVPKPQCFSMYDHPGADLSLRIGYPQKIDQQRNVSGEVDLELRLGHFP